MEIQKQKELIINMMYDITDEYYEKYRETDPDLADRVKNFCFQRIKARKHVLKRTEVKHCHNTGLAAARFRKIVEERLTLLKNRHNVQ